MNRSPAKIVAVDAARGEAWVEVPARAAACGACASASSCSSRPLDEGGGVRRYRVANVIGARVGEPVDLVVATGGVLRASWFSYLLPALLAIAAAMLGQAAGGDVPALIGMLLGLVVGFGYLRRVEKTGHRRVLVSIERPPRLAAASTCHSTEMM